MSGAQLWEGEEDLLAEVTDTQYGCKRHLQGGRLKLRWFANKDGANGNLSNVVWLEGGGAEKTCSADKRKWVKTVVFTIAAKK